MARKTVPKSEYASYTVGCICTQSQEFAAAQAMLDDEHGAPESRSGNDRNVYALGRMGPHNVAIACLPAGVPGASPAATIAADMQRTFKGLRFGLLVGVGSGAPRAADDIRLGDVVVSRPSHDTGGVVQFGRAAPPHNDAGSGGVSVSGSSSSRRRGPFVRGQSLNAPPTVLLTALTRLEAEHMLRGSRICDFLADAALKYPRMKAQFAAPVAGRGGGGDECNSADKLYEVSYVHQSGNVANDACDQCDASRLVQRPWRESPGPLVHYGVIASSDEEIQCGVTRDAANEALGAGVLCFEREAAGLMDDFPCLVVRGISDYADTHKSKTWIGYAAAAAAACAKELLEIMPPQEVQDMAVLKEVHTMMKEVKTSVAALHDSDEERRHRDILNWISSEDFAIRQRDLIGRHQQGTGGWFLDDSRFKSWRDGSTLNLLCPGIPGAGKSFMTAIVVNYLREHTPNAGVAVAYCSYMQQERVREKLLAGLVRQLVNQQHCESENVQALRRVCQLAGRSPTFDELSSLLQHIAGTYSQVFIVVDALDECPSAERLALISEIRRLQRLLPTIRVMATFRPHINLDDDVTNADKLEICASDSDLEHYLNCNISRLSPRVKETPSLEANVVQGIIRAAGGMFLLAKLHLDSLVGKRTVREIRHALEALPKGIHQLRQAYDQTFARIRSQDENDVCRAGNVFCWVTHALRPLSIVELQQALAVKADDRDLDQDDIVREDEIVAICAGLVTVDLETRIIRLIHYTTDEYLMGAGADWIADASELIASTCLRFLSFTSFSSGPCRTEEEIRARLTNYPFLVYAANNWGNHTYHAQDGVRELTVKFLQNDTLASHARRLGRISDRPFSPADTYIPSPEYDNSGTTMGIHLAAQFGLRQACSWLISNDSPAGVRDVDGRTPLFWAALNDHTDVVKVLLDCNDVVADTEDAEGGTPLICAAQWGSKELVELLQGSLGVAADFKDHDGRTPLSRAAQYGNVEVVQYLLDQPNVEPNLTDGQGRTPLSWAAHHGMVDVVRLLLGRDNVAADLADEGCRTPLSHAVASDGDIIKMALASAGCHLSSHWGYDTDRRRRRPPSLAAAHQTYREPANDSVETVLLLLGREDVAADSRDVDGRTPLSWAALSHDEKIVELLLDRGVDADSKDNQGRTPLSFAACLNERMVKLLLDRNDVVADSTDVWGRTPLHWAAAVQREAIVRLLLERVDAAADSTDNDGRTPFSMCMGTHFKTKSDRAAELLFDREDVAKDSRDRGGRTPLSWAAKNGMTKMVQRLLQTVGVDANSRDNDGRTPLSWAAVSGAAEVVKLFLHRDDVAPNLGDNNGRTPLSWAAQNDSYKVVEQLLGREDVDANAKDRNGRTPLSWAAEYGNSRKVKLLLERKNVSADSLDNNGKSPLYWLMKKKLSGHSRDKYVETAELLFAQQEVAAKTRDDNDRTPLSWAARHGMEGLVKLLLDRDDTLADSKDRWARTPLLYAAGHGHMDVVTLLLGRKDVDANSTDCDGVTPLSTAARYGHEGVVELLLDKSDVLADSKDRWAQTPLLHAASKGHEAVVRQLLDRKDVYPGSANTEGLTPLHYAAVNGHESVTKLLLDRSDVVADHRTNKGYAPLSAAAAKGHEAVVRLLLARADVVANSEDNLGRTPLFWAAKYGHDAVIKRLLDQDAVVADRTDSSGKTPLSTAARNGREAVVELLLGRPHVRADTRDNKGRQPLSRAAENGHGNVVMLLLDAVGGDTDPKDGNGRTPLWWTAAYGDKALAQKLVHKAGVDVNARDVYDRTPLMRAAEYGNEAFAAELLKQAGVDVNPKDIDGQTPLLVAAKNGHRAVVKLLLGCHGIDILSQDNSGRTACSWAMEEGHWAVMQLLAQAAAEAEVDGTEQLRPIELLWPSTEVQNIVDIDTAVNPPHVGPVDTYQGVAEPHITQPSAAFGTTPVRQPAPQPYSARPAQRRAGRHAAAAATLPRSCDGTIHLHATIGEYGTTASLSTRPSDQRTSADSDSGSVAISFNDSDAPAARLTLTVRITESS